MPWRAHVTSHRNLQGQLETTKVAFFPKVIKRTLRVKAFCESDSTSFFSHFFFSTPFVRTLPLFSPKVSYLYSSPLLYSSLLFHTSILQGNASQHNNITTTRDRDVSEGE